MNGLDPNLTRAQLLLEQHRYDAAEEHLRRSLLENPTEPLAHAWLSQCMLARHDYAGATHEAQQAISLAPDQGYFHHVLAIVYNERKMPKEASASIDEAIRLDPESSSNWGIRAHLLLQSKKHAEALEAADRALAIDPDNIQCTNVRAQALVGLGRRDEASQTMDAALRRDPDNAWTHANMGWTMLHAGKPKQAMPHFREALRLQPTMDWARQGIVEAMKARFFIYRIFLGYLLWMNRLSSRAQWGILIGGYLAYQLASGVSSSHPAAKPFLLPLIILYVAFAALTVLAYPLFNLLLCLNRFGRLALSTNDRIGAACLGVVMLAAGSTAGLWLWHAGDTTLRLAIVLAMFIIPVAITGTAPDARRRVMLIYTGATAAAGAAAMVMPILGIYALACVGSIWIGNILGTMPAKRHA